MRRPRFARTVWAALLAVMPPACDVTQDASSDASPPADEQDTAATGNPSGGEVSLSLLEPERLTTLDAIEVEGFAVLDALFTPLVTYDPDTSAPINAMADSITTSDGGRTWTVSLVDGWTFHNGEPVTAQSYVDAWNAGAYGPNAHANAGFFSDIEGFEALNPSDPEAAPDAQQLAGLQQIDDLTFEVTLATPQPTWSAKLGYPAFAPLPQAYFDDPDGFEDQPIGNGPFRMAGPWRRDQAIRVERWADWPGEPQPTVDAIDFVIYADVGTATTDLLAGNLDMVVDVPAARWADVRQQLGDEQTMTTPSSSVTFLGFPLEAEPFAGERGRQLRTALSLALDQEQIVAAIFDNTELPAANLLPPVMPGYDEQVCPAWGTDAERAQELYAAGEPIETLTLWFNSGSGQEEWIEAAATQWRDVLGVEDITFESLQPADYLPKVAGGEIEGPFRLGWSMDYPHPQTFLEPLLASWMLPEDGGANVFRYTSPEYDAALREGLEATSEGDAIPAFQQAVAIACNDVPLVPVYFGQQLTAFAEDVDDVHVDPFGFVDYLRISTAR